MVSDSSESNPIGEQDILFWEEAQLLKSNAEGSWCLVGDFNFTTFLHEYSKGGSQGAREHFMNWINDLQLIDLRFSCSPFTWSKGVRSAT